MPYQHSKRGQANGGGIIMSLLSAIFGGGNPVPMGSEGIAKIASATPFTDSTFDAGLLEGLHKPSSMFQRMSGNTAADDLNKEIFSKAQDIRMQPFKDEQALSFKRSGLGIEQQAKEAAERNAMAQLGKTTFDTFGDRFDLPLDFSGSDEEIGRRTALAFPDLVKQGNTTFSKSSSDIAGNRAAQLGFENQIIKGQAEQPFIAPTTANLAQRGQIESTLGLDFVKGQDFQSRIFPTSQARKYLEPIQAGMGTTIFDEATRSKYTGAVPTENIKMKSIIGPDGKTMMQLPETTRGYEPGSVNPFGGIKLDVIDPSPPRSVNTPPAPAESSVPSRNQDTTFGGVYNPLVPNSELERMQLLDYIKRMQMQRPPYGTNVIPPSAINPY